MAAVALCAAVSLALYLLLPCVVRPLASSEPSRAHEVFPWVKPVTREMLDAFDGGSPAPFIGCCVALFTTYGCVLRLARGRQPFALQALLFAAGAAFLLSFLFAPVMLSTDVLSYAMYGRVFSAYGSSPYLDVPPPRSDPFYAILRLRYIPSVYGPFWTLLSAGVAKIGGGRIGLTVLLFRMLGCGAALSGAAFTWSALRRHAPERATQGLAMFLWNPLVLIESGLSGHNDATMVALLLLGVALHVRGRKAGAAAAIMLSGLVKFVTGTLVPLYMWMVLREARTWRERRLFLLRGGLAAGAVFVAAVTLGRANTGVPAAHFAASAQFYSNNFHELLLAGVRRLLGEDPASVQAPVTFGSYWVAVTSADVLHADASEKAAALTTLPKSRKLIVIAPHLDADWLRVFDPVTHLKGYVYYPSVDEIPDPDGMDSDPDVAHLEDTLLDWPTVQRANAIIHTTTWALFAAFGLLAAWRTKNFDRFLTWSAAVMLASYYLIMTQFWPWYLLWAVALGALKPQGSPAKLALLLSGCVLTLYVTINYENGDDQWVYVCRSLPALVLPLLLFTILYGFRAARERRLGGL